MDPGPNVTNQRYVSKFAERRRLIAAAWSSLGDVMSFEELLQQLTAGQVSVEIRPNLPPGSRTPLIAHQVNLAQNRQQARTPTFVADWKQGLIGVSREQALQLLESGAVDNARLTA